MDMTQTISDMLKNDLPLEKIIDIIGDLILFIWKTHSNGFSLGLSNFDLFVLDEYSDSTYTYVNIPSTKFVRSTRDYIVEDYFNLLQYLFEFEKEPILKIIESIEKIFKTLSQDFNSRDLNEKEDLIQEKNAIGEVFIELKKIRNYPKIKSIEVCDR